MNTLPLIRATERRDQSLAIIQFNLDTLKNQTERLGKLPADWEQVEELERIEGILEIVKRSLFTLLAAKGQKP